MHSERDSLTSNVNNLIYAEALTKKEKNHPALKNESDSSCIVIFFFPTTFNN